MILRQLLGIAPHLGVVAVAVGGLHDDIVRPGTVAGVPDDGLVHIADVAGEDDGPGLIPLHGGDGDAGAAQQVSRIGKDGADSLADLHPLAVLTGADILGHLLGVFNGVERVYMGRAGPGALAVFPLRVLLLNVGGVQQHDGHELGREAGGKDGTLESLFDQQRDPAGVVDVGMGHQHRVDLVGSKGQGLVIDLVPPLLQSAVHQDAFPVYLQAVAAAGHTLVRAKKAQSHRMSSFEPGSFRMWMGQRAHPLPSRRE